MEKEIWKDIPGYEGYQASSYGRIRSKTRTVERRSKWGEGAWVYKGRILSPSANKKGYLGLSMMINKRTVCRSVHRLVALAFLGECPQGYEVDHINKDRTDNRIENLRWFPIGENRSRGTKGVKLPPYRNRMGNNPRAKKVIVYEEGRIVDTISCAKYISQEYGVNYDAVLKALNSGGLSLNGREYRYEINS